MRREQVIVVKLGTSVLTGGTDKLDSDNYDNAQDTGDAGHDDDVMVMMTVTTVCQRQWQLWWL